MSERDYFCGNCGAEGVFQVTAAWWDDGAPWCPACADPVIASFKDEESRRERYEQEQAYQKETLDLSEKGRKQ
jgi:hypothetical protein